MKKYVDTGSLLIGSLAFFVVSTGCASTTLTLPSNHPARPDAPSGQGQSEPAAVLRPDAPLYSSEALAVFPEEEQVSSPDGTREAPYVGQGVIQGIEEGQLDIQHEAIPGFMGAMRMAFQVDEESMDDSFEVGDEIIFKIEDHPERGYQIFSVDAMAAESDEVPTDKTGNEHNSPDPTGSSTPPTTQP